MAYFSREFDFKQFIQIAANSGGQKFSLQLLRMIIAGFLLASILVIYLFCDPAFLQIQKLQAEKNYWKHLSNNAAAESLTAIPSMDQLPDMIDQCQSMFVREGVDVITFNVERFGEQRDSSKKKVLDFSLVRLRLRGNWEGIITALKVLEDPSQTQRIRVQVQEAVLDTEGGETLLQIYFQD